VLCFLQLVHAQASRSSRESLFRMGILGSKPMAVAVACSVAAQLVVMIGPLGPLFRVERPTGPEWALVAISSLSILGVTELIKAAKRSVDGEDEGDRRRRPPG
jgi:magnesium-transporting ATPase (P-type)